MSVRHLDIVSGPSRTCLRCGVGAFIVAFRASLRRARFLHSREEFLCPRFSFDVPLQNLQTHGKFSPFRERACENAPDRSCRSKKSNGCQLEAIFSDKKRAAFYSEKSESETDIVGIAKATVAMERRLGESLGLPLSAEKLLKTMGDEM